MQGPGWGEDTSKAGTAPDAAVWGGTVGTAGTGAQAGKADAQADCIPFQEPQRFTPGSASPGPSWMTSGESQTQKCWGWQWLSHS